MKRYNQKKYLAARGKARFIVENVLTESAEAHRCMDGSMVPVDSVECFEDILERIDDAVYHRDHHSCGTENRIYYNGLLKNLRQKRNRLQKILIIMDEQS